LPRGPAARVSYGSNWEYRPQWRPGGRWVTFLTETTFAMRRADGTGGDSILWAGRADEGLVTPDGRWAVLRVGSTSSAAGGRDVYVLQLGVDSVPKPLLTGPYDEMAIALSPDGRWLAYGSDETGRLEVFVRPFPNVGDGKEQVSDAGGTGPLWSRDGRELFYLRRDNAMMAVPVGSDGSPRVGESRILFQVRSPLLAGLSSERYTPWDVGRDGRFIMVRAVGRDSKATRSLVVVENGLEEVKAMMRR
jgi:serine/threonine-protein kinase